MTEPLPPHELRRSLRLSVRGAYAFHDAHRVANPGHKGTCQDERPHADDLADAILPFVQEQVDPERLRLLQEIADVARSNHHVVGGYERFGCVCGRNPCPLHKPLRALYDYGQRHG